MASDNTARTTINSVAWHDVVDLSQLRYFALLPLLASLSACQGFPTEQEQIHIRQYSEHVTRKIEIIGAQRYPQLATMVRHNTRIRLRLRIAHSGKLLGVELLESSKYPSLDELMLELIHYAAPYPPMPDEIRQGALDLERTWQFTPISDANLPHN